MPAAPLLPPIALKLVPELLRRRGVVVSYQQLKRAAAAGALPIRWRGARLFVDEADLPTVETYFRTYQPCPPRRGARVLP
jgi:hypothetical protein